MYESIQETLPNECASLPELIAQIIWQCRIRGVHHHGQQNYIVEQVLKDYTFANNSTNR
jgi:hypothetical protein